MKLQRLSALSTARMRLVEFVQCGLRRVGYELHLYPEPSPRSEEEQRLALLLVSQRVSVVLDVGANVGQYARRLRRRGYANRIVSFEPLPDAGARLRAVAASDRAWEVRGEALGDADGEAALNIAGNSFSSSLLPMGARHLATAPESAYEGTAQITTRRLETVWDEVVHAGDRPWLKLDVQGYEMAALRGAEAVLERVVGIQVELSLVRLYENGPLWHEVVEHLDRHGFELAGFEGGFTDWRTGRMLQADALFVRPGVPAPGDPHAVVD